MSFLSAIVLFTCLCVSPALKSVSRDPVWLVPCYIPVPTTVFGIQHSNIFKKRKREGNSKSKRERERERGRRTQVRPLVQAQLGWLLLSLGHWDTGSALAWPRFSGGWHAPGSLRHTEKQNLQPRKAVTLHGTPGAWWAHEVLNRIRSKVFFW